MLGPVELLLLLGCDMVLRLLILLLILPWGLLLRQSGRLLLLLLLVLTLGLWSQSLLRL